MKTRVLELNASDERGISIVREKIKNFARTTVSTAVKSVPPRLSFSLMSLALTRDRGFPCPPYKIIILDEADSMTQDAQSALRRTMETYSKITRFCLICNYVTRIIEPLTSRCAKFRFKPLDASSTRSRIEHIAEAEGVPMETGVVDALVRTAEGDLRKAITYLQTAARMLPAGGEEGGEDVVMGGTGVVSVEGIEEIAGVVPGELIERLLHVCLPGKIGLYSRVAPVVEEIVAEGWSAGAVVTQVHSRSLASISFPFLHCLPLLAFSIRG